jgi:hypothetical protein
MVRHSAAVSSSTQNQHFCDPDFYSMEFIPELKQKFRFNKPEDVVDRADQTLSKKRANDDVRKNGFVKRKRSESEADTFKGSVSDVMNGQVNQGFTAIQNLYPVLGSERSAVPLPYRLLSNEPIPSRIGSSLAGNLVAIYGDINRVSTLQQHQHSTQLLPYLDLSCSAAAPPTTLPNHVALLAPQVMRPTSDSFSFQVGSGLAGVHNPLYERLHMFPSSVALEMQSVALERFKDEARVHAAIRRGVNGVLKRNQPLKHRYPVSDAVSHGIPGVAAVNPLSLLATSMVSDFEEYPRT